MNIDTGTYGFGVGAIYATAQDLLLQPAWNGLVWSVHALIVTLEWCYTVDLLGGPAMGAVAHALSEVQAVFTRPALVVVFAIAAMLALYHGIVRRRVAQTLGEVMLMLAMMAAGLWVIVNPLGTVGTLARWANQASVGTLAAVAGGTPAHSGRTLAGSLAGTFQSAIVGPWCYMEFGNVRWCEDAAQLDPRLSSAAHELGARDQAGASAALLRAARTNGELFLALPAGAAARNSFTARGSLLQALCGGGADAVSCHGPTASEALFRTQSGTAARFAGLLLIAVGLVGMLLLLGFLALQLLGAALVSLLYLLLAPAAVLAPALGDGGRSAFRGWAARLAGALTSKLLYSFLLGALLLLARILTQLQALGWWIQWLLLSALWWGAFRHRHDVLGLAHGASQSAQLRRRPFTRRVKEVLEIPREIARTSRRFTRLPGSSRGAEEPAFTFPAPAPAAAAQAPSDSGQSTSRSPVDLKAQERAQADQHMRYGELVYERERTAEAERVARRSASTRASPVMRDAFAVAAGEKPHLGVLKAK